MDLVIWICLQIWWAN